MLAALIPDELTPMTALEVAKAFRGAFETLCGVTPSNDCLAVLVAQSALECGRWKSLHNYGFGNAKAGPKYEGYYCQFPCDEIINGKREVFYPPHPQTNFRAFLNAETGALEQLQLLKNRWPVAWHAAQQGAPLSFVDALAAGRYFTADPKPYSRAVASLFREYQALLSKLEADTEPEIRLDEAELHAEALAAKANFDPLEAAHEERVEQLKED